MYSATLHNGGVKVHVGTIFPPGWENFKICETFLISEILINSVFWHKVREHKKI